MKWDELRVGDTIMNARLGNVYVLLWRGDMLGGPKAKVRHREVKWLTIQPAGARIIELGHIEADKDVNLKTYVYMPARDRI